MSLIELGEDLIVANVARFLRPMDIFNLSLTCKDMRAFFESNNAYHLLYSKVFGSKPTPLSAEHYDWKHLFQLRTSNARLYTWGSPDQGRLGYLTLEVDQTHVNSSLLRKGVFLPTNVEVFNDLVVSDISAGGFSFQILTNDGDLYYTGASWKMLRSLGRPTPGPVGMMDFSPTMASGGLYFPTPLPSLARNRGRATEMPGVAAPPGISGRYDRSVESGSSMQRTDDSSSLTQPPETLREKKRRTPIDAKFVTKLELPAPLEGFLAEKRNIVSISSGREHFIALDNQNGIYTWDTGNSTNIGVRIVFPGIDQRKRITKISCGWNLSACHIHEVGVVVWYTREAVSEDSHLSNKLTANAKYVIIPGSNLFTPRDILAGLDYVLLIDRDGELACFDIHAQGYSNGRIAPTTVQKTHYVNAFKNWLSQKKRSGQETTYTKLSGCYNLFAVFASDGLVLIGKKEMTSASSEDDSPLVIPELQNRGIIDVSVGDYHYLALTDKGELLSWGSEPALCGCLGLGSREAFLREHPEDLNDSSNELKARRPVVVKSPNTDGEWLAIAAAGWHSAAVFVCHSLLEF